MRGPLENLYRLKQDSLSAAIIKCLLKGTKPGLVQLQAHAQGEGETQKTHYDRGPCNITLNNPGDTSIRSEHGE
jgi:hypothetical protein